MAREHEPSIWVRLFTQVLDLVMTMVSFVVAFALRSMVRTLFAYGSALTITDYYGFLIVVVIVWWLLLDIQKAYTESRRVALSRQLRLVIRTAILGIFVALGIAFALRLESPPRGVIAFFGVLNVMLLFLNRVFLRYWREYLRKGGALTKTILVVGAGEKAVRLLQSVSDHAQWDVDLVGFVDFDKSRVGQEFMGARVLGTPESLTTILHEHPIDEVVFAVPTRQLEECTDMLALCEQEGVNAIILSNFFSSLVAQVETEILYDQPVLAYRTTRHKEWQLLVKRVFDLAVSATLLLLLLPTLLIIALIIKLGDGGPVFYTWKVVGQNKKKFTGYKFRTMIIDADRVKERLLQQNEMSGVVFKMKHDPRVTRVGHFLRRYSLDELPQLWSVLRGHMSVVGPRPPLESELPRFESWHRRKLSVKPGLTCLWQISGRSTVTNFDDWVKMDLAYIDKWSLWLDFKILLKTIPVVLSGRGAH